MILSNDLNLPQPLVNAIANDGYSSGKSDYSATSLIKPVRIVSLMRRHGAQIAEDAADRIFSLIGQSIHTILERAASARYVVEKRYFHRFGDKIVSGQIDVFDTQDEILSDYKVCSRYVVSDGIKPDWTAQASINRLLMHYNGVTVKGAQIVAIFRDWSKMAAARQNDYPDRQVAVLPVPLWPLAQTEQFITERIAAHEAARENPPVCTPEERWQDPDKWAHMRKGQKRAVKLYLDEAEAKAAATGDKDFVEARIGEPKRCLFYCALTSWCDFGQAALREASGA